MLRNTQDLSGKRSGLVLCLEVRGQWCLLLKPVRDCSALGEKILSHWMARRERSSHYIKVRAIIYGYYMEESWGEMMNDEWWTLPWRLYLLIFLSSFLQELKAHILPLTNVAFDKSGSRYVYSICNTQKFGTLKIRKSSVCLLYCSSLFSLTLCRFITGSYDRTCRVWDTASGTELHKLEGHRNVVYTVAFNNPYG